MMKRAIEKVAKAFWVIGQPLSRVPSSLGCPVSDLFIWRKSEEWQTFFELTNLPSLLEDQDDSEKGYADLFFFDSKGGRLGQLRIECDPVRRQTLAISDLLPDGGAHTFGTFAVFHSRTPKQVQAGGSFLAERGYVSYRYRGAPVRNYVHGNLDAIALASEGELEFLGTTGWLNREFRLQYEFSGEAAYELALVNPSARREQTSITLLSIPHGSSTYNISQTLSPGEITLVPIKISEAGRFRVVIRSRLVMARPVVFHFFNQKLDVFHG